ncbi:MAG: hypothetical protein WC055_02085 [Melioribacteraceae bacterium]
METNNNGGQEPQSGTVKPIWEKIGGQTDLVEIVTPTPSAEVKQDIQTEDTTTPSTESETTPAIEVKPDAKTEGAATETKPETTPEAKTDTEVLELTAEDIKDAPAQYEDGTFKALAADLGFEVPEESFEVFHKTFKENFVPKAEVDKIATANKEKFFATLDPKIATAFELIEMGVPQELALNPTKAQDEYLAMDSQSLVRAALAAQPNWTEEMVETQMEELALEPSKLEVKANIVRANLTAEKQQILQEQQQIVQKYTEQKQQAALQQKMEVDKQFKEALANEQAFMGVTLSKEYKEAILSKYNKGAYNEVLSPAQAKVRAIILMESGDKFAKTALSKAKEDGKAEIVRKLSDVPPKNPNAGGRQQVVAADNQEDKSPFKNIPIFE